jgi:E3 ubiquitin-protein ligase HUWE1
MKMVVSSRAFDSYFEIFESPEHVRAMATDIEIPTNIGNNFDELSRHHPALRPAISNAVLDMVVRISHLSRVKATESGWGTKLLVKDASGKDVVADATLLNRIASSAEKGKAVALPEDMDNTLADVDASLDEPEDIEMFDADEIIPGISGSPRPVKIPDFRPDYFSPQKAITPYIFAASTFLQQCIQNPHLRGSLIQEGGIEHLLDLCTSPSLPHTFCDSIASRNLQNVIAQLVESSPVIGMPSLLKRTQEAIDVLQPVISTADFKAYFTPFLQADVTVTGDASQENLDILMSGTPVVKAILNAQSLMKTLYQCFPYSSRAQSITLPAINVYDYYDRLAKSLGPLLRTAISQEMAIVRCVPQNWVIKKDEARSSERQTPAINGSGVGNSEAVGEEDEAGLSDVISAAAIFKPVDKAGGASKSEQTSPRFRNYDTIRVLLHSLMPSTFPLLQALGKALLSRRGDRDAYTRSNHIKLANSLAQTILDQLELPELQRSTVHFNYLIIMVHTVHEMLLDRKLDGGRHSDRQGTHIIAPVMVAFKQKGGLDKLNSMLRIFAEEICKDHAGGEDVSVSRLAVIAMKKILELYAVMVNGKVISESVLQTAFLTRSTSRSTESQIGPNLVVELRMAILPVMRDLWESPLAEKAAPPILAKIIEILKSISITDFESQAYKRSDKNRPPVLLQHAPAPFAWAACADHITQLKSNGYDEDLAQEAIYRASANPSANQNLNTATEYCKAHKASKAGSRNPIPEDDSPDKVDMDEPMSPLASSSGPVHEPMLLDLPADLPAGLLPAGLLDEENLDLRPVAVNPPANGQDMTNLPASRQEVNGGAGSSSTSPAQGASSTNTDENAENPSAVPKEDLDAERTTLRTKLIDRCLDIIRAHPGSSYEVSELISAVVLRSSTDDSAKQEVGETLVNALMSFALDDDVKPNGQSIAAYAHLLSLLLQDRGFFQATASSLRENVSEFLRFLQVSSPPGEDLAPWIPYILLIFEILLSDDEQPGDIKWKSPANEDEPIESFQWPVKDFIVKEDDRHTLMESILELLPRVGKDESLAISVLRILVILTRNRATGRVIGDKKNLQRLFVMTKQLSGFGSARLGESRISSYVLNILRHIIEDEEIVKQLMKSEIRALFDNNRVQRPLDVSQYLRQLSHVALRDPRLFVEVTNEMVRLSRWSAGEQRHHHVVLKEQKTDASKDDVAPTVRATEDLSIQDVKPSTENSQTQNADAAKPVLQDTKRPILENPDGVIHFLLCELLNYKEVDDKEPSQATKDSKESKESEASPSNGSTGAIENRSLDNKDKKAKVSFKADEHPIFIYRCFILRCLTELLQSYNQTKVEFINFKRSGPLQTHTPIKPRTSVLNYLLTDLLCPSRTDGSPDSLADKKRYTTAVQAQNLLVALVSKTGEKPIDRSREKYDYDEEPDLLFVRRFVLDTILKAYKDASSSNEAFDTRYGRMLALAEVMYLMMGEKEKDMSSSSRHSHDLPPERPQIQMRRLMYEKGYLGTLTTSIADIDLAFPPVKKTIRKILLVLRILTSTAIQLSNANILPAASTLENVEDDIASATSLSDMEDDREETPDLYRNSSLGMLEPGRDPEEDYSEESEDGEAHIILGSAHGRWLTLSGDEEMYDDEYGDEMEYEEGISVDGEENVSDEDEEVEGMGHIEGLPGDLGVVEVTMDDDDDDDDEDDDDMDEDDDEVSEDDDEFGSDGMDGIEDRIEIVDDEGNPVEDDGASGWESETDGDEEEDDDDEDDEDDYEAEAQDLEEAQIHGLEDIDGLGRIGNIMRAIQEDGYEPGDDLNNGNPYLEEEDDEDGKLRPWYYLC